MDRPTYGCVHLNQKTNEKISALASKMGQIIKVAHYHAD